MRIDYWSQSGKAFPDVTFELFRKLGARDPIRVSDDWQYWLDLKDRTDDAKFRKLLELVTGLGRTSVRNYLSKFHEGVPDNWDQLARNTRKRLDEVARALGFLQKESPEEAAAQFRSIPQPLSKKRSHYLAVFTQFSGIASPRFHLTVLESVIQAGEQQNCLVVLHSVDPEHQLASVERVVHAHQPDGAIWFRITPSRAVFECLRRAYIPAVIIHGDLVKYPAPVIVHVLPGYIGLSSHVQSWASGLRRKTGLIKLAAMEPEPRADLEPMNPTRPVNLRQQRLDAVRLGIKEARFSLETIFLSDYTAAQAWRVVQGKPVDGYICFSDEIAISVQQLLTSQGVKAASRRVLGFDGSDAARLHSIPTIDQHLHDIGEKAVGPLLKWLRKRRDYWPPCEEIRIDVGLTQ